MGMTDERINVIVYNAFNGMGDSVGEDDFGYSVAWLDLHDYIEIYDRKVLPAGVVNKTDNISDWLKTHPDVKGNRWVLAYLDSNGSRSVVSYADKSSMMKIFKEQSNDYSRWLRS